MLNIRFKMKESPDRTHQDFRSLQEEVQIFKAPLEGNASTISRSYSVPKRNNSDFLSRSRSLSHTENPDLTDDLMQRLNRIHTDLQSEFGKSRMSCASFSQNHIHSDASESGFSSTKGSLAQKFEEVENLLSTLGSNAEKTEFAHELSDTLNALLKKYEAAQSGERGMKRVRSHHLLDQYPDRPTPDYDDDVLHCGYLGKRGEWLPTYRRRFVVLLNSGHLRYYLDSTCIVKRGEINFLKCHRVDFNGEFFEIKSNDSCWSFQCEDPRALKMWKKAFEQAFQLEKQGCSVNLCQGLLMKKEGKWGGWKKRFFTLDDRGKLRLYHDEKASVVAESMNVKGLDWEDFQVNWKNWPCGMRATINATPVALAFPHIDKRTIFHRELARAHELCNYAPTVVPNW